MPDQKYTDPDVVGRFRGRCTRGTGGFSLLELLVVVGLLVLLAAVLLPTLGAVQQAARQAACLSNLRQLGLATQGYATDFRSYLPQPDEDDDIPTATARAAACWFNALDTYLNQQVLAYRSGNTAQRNYREFKQDPVWRSLPAAGSPGREDNRTIKMNGYLGDPGGNDFGDLNDARPGLAPLHWKFFRLSEVSRPGLTVAYFDGRAGDTPSVTTGDLDTTHLKWFHGNEIYVALRHANQSANVMLLDGHGENGRQAVRQMDSGYQGWYNGANGGLQKYNWFHLGRNGINDN